MYNLLSIVSLGESLVGILSSLGIWYAILVNAFGVFAIGFKLIESQQKKRGLIMLFAIASTIAWIIYYILNGNLATALIVIIGILKYFIFAEREKHAWANSPIWLILFIVVQVVICAFAVKEDWTALLSCAAGIFSTFAYYTLNVKQYKYILLTSQLCWVFNGVFNGYTIAYISDIIICIAIIIGIIRYTIEEKKVQKENIQ